MILRYCKYGRGVEFWWTFCEIVGFSCFVENDGGATIAVVNVNNWRYISRNSGASSALNSQPVNSEARGSSQSLKGEK